MVFCGSVLCDVVLYGVEIDLDFFEVKVIILVVDLIEDGIVLDYVLWIDLCVVMVDGSECSLFD